MKLKDRGDRIYYLSECKELGGGFGEVERWNMGIEFKMA